MVKDGKSAQFVLLYNKTFDDVKYLGTLDLGFMVIVGSFYL